MVFVSILERKLEDETFSHVLFLLISMVMQ